jgi:3-methyladenine DNA glycosylase AlkD
MSSTTTAGTSASSSTTEPIAVSAVAPTLVGLRRRLRALADRSHAEASRWFFKTGRGQYGEGDRFLGIRVPVLRTLVREYAPLSRAAVASLLQSPWHEERLLAALLLVHQYEHGTAADRTAIFRLYLRSLRHINNWDIVDASAPAIVGRHLDGTGRATLLRLAKTKRLWSRRVAMLATFHDIKRGAHGDAVAIATVLLKDEHDLIHKAVGWMLREVGQRDREILEAFLDAHAAEMPRTMLRYATEKFTPARRRHYRGKVR